MAYQPVIEFDWGGAIQDFGNSYYGASAESAKTQELGLKTYEKAGLLDDPLKISAFVMGGAGAGGGASTVEATPELLASLGIPTPGGNFRYSDWVWDPVTRKLTNKYGQGSYDYSWEALGGNPALGIDVVVPNGQTVDASGYASRNGNVLHFDAGTPPPFFGFPDGGNMFISNVPEDIREYKHDARTRALQGIAQVGALVGAAAAGGGIGGGGAAVGGGGAGGGGSAVTKALGNIVGLGGGGSGGSVASASGKTGLLSRIGGFLKNNRDILGAVISGIGENMAAKNAYEAEMNLLRERQNLISENYRGASPGAKYRGLALNTQTEAPAQRFSPDKYTGYEYRWDPQQGRVVRMRVEK